MNDLDQSIRFSIEEMCIKMGCVLPGCSLNYPAASLLRMLKLERSSQLQEAINDYCVSFTGRYGKISCSPFESGWCFTFEADTVKWIAENPIGGEFLKSVCMLSSQHHATEQEWFHSFSFFGDAKLIKAHDPEYDFVLYYPSGHPVSFVYCLKKDGNHISSHRLERIDFEGLYGALS